MENLLPHVTDEAKNTTKNKQEPILEETLLVDLSPISFYCTPSTLCSSLSTVSSRSCYKSVKSALVQNNSPIFNEDPSVPLLQEEKIHQRLSFPSSDSPQADSTSAKDPAVPAPDNCNFQSFTIVKDDKGISPPSTSFEPALPTPHTILSNTFNTDTVNKTLHKNLESTYIAPQGGGDIVAPQNALDILVDVDVDALVVEEEVQSARLHCGQGDDHPVPRVMSETFCEASLPVQGDNSGKDRTYHKDGTELDVGHPAPPSDTVAADNVEASPESDDADKSDGDKSTADVGRQTNLSSQPSDMLRSTFEMAEPSKESLNTTVDKYGSNEVCSKANARKGPVAGSANKQTSQSVVGVAKKIPMKPSLLPHTAPQKAALIKRTALRTASQAALPVKTSQPLRATLDSKMGLGPQSTKAKVPSRQLRPPVQTATSTNLASKPSASNRPLGTTSQGLKEKFISRQPIKDTVLVKASGQKTAAKTLAAPVTQGANRGVTLKGPQSSTSTSSTAQGLKSEIARPQTSSTTRLQRPKIGLRLPHHGRLPVTQPAQAKRNLASTPVRNQAPPDISSAELPTPIKKC